MTSQVSFKFDGNKEPILNLLKQQLRGLKYKIETEGQNVYRIYVASLEDEKKTFDVCSKIQCFAVYDYNRII